MSSRFFKDIAPCPEAKLIFALGALGCVAGSLSGLALTEKYTNQDAGFIAIGTIVGAFGGFSIGIVLGKMIGEIGRFTNTCFPWQEEEQPLLRSLP